MPGGPRQPGHAGARNRSRRPKKTTGFILFFGWKILGWKIFGWKGEDAFGAFRNDPPVGDTMRSGGTGRLPEVTIPKKIAELPG